ncbi:MAG: hypothetical protein CL561_06500 [Alphaproteobacteria bacterium]|nr:hypothetical protein [Alphaproteobacteria bacterium]
MAATKQVSDRTRNIFILIFAVILCWFMYDRLSVISNSTVQNATILDCENSWTTQRTGSSMSSPTRDVVVSAPVAMTDDGQKAVGTVKVPEKRCDAMIGNAVKVYIHNTDPTKNRINSFLQFWFFPSIFAFLAFAVFFNSQRPALGFFTTLCFFGFCGYMVASELNYLDLGKKAASENMNAAPSELALDRCVKREMLDKGYQTRAEITKLVCQSAKITDLSSIHDLTNLTGMYLQDNNLESLESLGYYPSLKSISVAGNKMLTTLRGIENAPNLEEFQANKSGLIDLNGLEQLPNLRIIGAMMNNIQDISPLAKLDKLEDVVLNYNPISDISALTNKPALTALQVYSSKVSDITPLYTNTKLTKGGVTSDVGYPCEQIQQLKAQIDPASRFHVPDECK